jgi:NAD(P)-dependent dehydrogenase (short-subunit alcohol dehydrogenase family)
VSKEVVVVIGVGGMGLAVARRQGPGKAVLLADISEQSLDAAATALSEEGIGASTHTLDVSSRRAVAQLADSADALGSVKQVVHTAGLSPAQASVDAILQVDLLGVAFVLEEFGEIVADQGAGVVISSMAAHIQRPLTAEQEGALAHTPADQLLQLPFTRTETVATPGDAYALAKRGNQVRVTAASVAWGERGARINSISPGVISTSMGRTELDSPSGPFMRKMVQASPSGRHGTPHDVAAAAAFLLSDQASFITGTDLLVDGGVVAALHSGRVSLPG